MKFVQVAVVLTRVVIATMVVAIHTTEAFAPWGRSTARASLVVVGAEASSAATLVQNLPTVDELTTAPFMKQVRYGTDMTDALNALSLPSSDNDNNNDDDDDENQQQLSDTLRASLTAQLSHSDGIRGFMVAYLTGSYESSTDADGSIDAQEMIATERDPAVLLETIHLLLAKEKDESSDELVSLMCMNVVMPIAMVTQHQDAALSEASKLTAARGIRLLGSVMEASDSIRANIEALLEASTNASDDDDDDTLDDDDGRVAFWIQFFGKWGYEAPQKEDIAATMKELLAKSSP